MMELVHYMLGELTVEKVKRDFVNLNLLPTPFKMDNSKQRKIKNQVS